MKLLIYTAVWKRPEITEICFMGIKRLQKVHGFEISAFAVISEESMIPLCEKYGVDWCMYDNLPLGRKKNYGVSQALKKDFDYLIEIGSDDLLKNEYLEAIAPYFGADLIGIDHCIYINSETGGCRSVVFPKGFGMGRAMSRKAIEKVGKIWPDGISQSMDNNSIMTFALQRIGETRVKSLVPLGIDIKSKVNIWPYSAYTGLSEKYPIEKAFDGLNSEEVTAIKMLYAKVQV